MVVTSFPAKLITTQQKIRHTKSLWGYLICMANTRRGWTKAFYVYFFCFLELGQALITCNTYYPSPPFCLQDPDQPLTYEFYYKTDNGLYTVVSYGSEDHVTTVLPSGKREDDYEIGFEIMVTDSLSAATHVLLNIRVGSADLCLSRKNVSKEM